MTRVSVLFVFVCRLIVAHFRTLFDFDRFQVRFDFFFKRSAPRGKRMNRDKVGVVLAVWIGQNTLCYADNVWVTARVGPKIDSSTIVVIRMVVIPNYRRTLKDARDLLNRLVWNSPRNHTRTLIERVTGELQITEPTITHLSTWSLFENSGTFRFLWDRTTLPQMVLQTKHNTLILIKSYSYFQLFKLTRWTKHKIFGRSQFLK